MIQLNQYYVISIEIWLKCRVLLEFSWSLKNYKRLIKALLKIKLFRIDLNIVFCKESKILCKITLGIGISCPCERTISSQYLLYNKRQTWILETVEFMDVTDDRYRWRCVVLWEKEKQYREPMCCWTEISVRKLLFSAKFLNVDYAWMYAHEVDAVKLESRGLFTVAVNLNMAEYWDSWMVVFPPKMLVVGIVVPERGIKS